MWFAKILRIYIFWQMVRQRRVNGATGGTSGRGGEEIHRTVSRSEEPRDTFSTSTRDSNYPRRSWRDSCERRDTWKNPSRDPSREQGGGSQGRGDARGSPRMEWSSRLDDGRGGHPSRGYRIYQTEERWNLQRAEKTAERRQHSALESGTFAHSISENTKSRGILFWRLEWSSAGRRWVASAR